MHSLGYGRIGRHDDIGQDLVVGELVESRCHALEARLPIFTPMTGHQQFEMPPGKPATCLYLSKK